MKRVALLAVVLLVLSAAGVAADESDPVTDGRADTIPNAVRVVIVRSGGEDTVSSVSGGGTGQQGCDWDVVFIATPEVVPEGSDFGPKPHPDAELALLMCNGSIVQTIWVTPSDIIDLDAAAQNEAERYIEDVLVPAVRIGVNPAPRGLVGLPSWFWIEGFDGQATASPITAFGLTIEVRMSSGSVSWDFGDGTVETGDLGHAYPEESTVQHVHQRDGTFTITASIDLVPEYRVDGGAWITLPNLQAIATASHEVDEREAVVTQT